MCAGANEFLVLLASPKIAFTAGHVDIRQSAEEALVVQSSNPPFPLRRFAVDTPEGVDAGDLHDALMDLRRLLVWFEAGPASGGRVAYFRKPLDIAARKGRVSSHMLEFALFGRACSTKKGSFTWQHRRTCKWACSDTERRDRSKCGGLS